MDARRVDADSSGAREGTARLSDRPLRGVVLRLSEECASVARAGQRATQQAALINRCGIRLIHRTGPGLRRSSQVRRREPVGSLAAASCRFPAPRVPDHVPEPRLVHPEDCVPNRSDQVAGLPLRYSHEKIRPAPGRTRNNDGRGSHSSAASQRFRSAPFRRHAMRLLGCAGCRAALPGGRFPAGQ